MSADEDGGRLDAEMRELDLLIESSRTEVNRLKSREDQVRARLEEMRQALANYQREEILSASDDHAAATGRRMTMEGELASLQAKRRLLDRLSESRARAVPEPVPEPASVPARPDESRMLQAIVDTQEEERRRIARQVHDGPAQAMANVVLQSEISQRLFDIDPARARDELAALRQMVNRTLQELRGFIFELRPMILDDLGLVPTLRRYVQTLIDKHGVGIDFLSNGRDRRLPTDAEVAVFRLIQDAMVERIEKGGAEDLTLAMSWQETSLDVRLDTDGSDLGSDAESASGLPRSERLELLRATAQQSVRDGRMAIEVSVPLRPVEIIR